jgi:hypothetical protein
MATPYDVEWTDSAVQARRELSEDGQNAVFNLVQVLSEDLGGRDVTAAPEQPIVFRDLATKVSITYDCDARRRSLRVIHVAQPQVPVPPQLFISYSHLDREWLDKLRPFLAALEEQQMLRVWDDTKLRAGEQWLPEIEAALRDSRAVLFLVTTHFLASPFIQHTEMPRALDVAEKRGCALLWILVRDCPWRVVKVLKTFHALHMAPPLALIPDLERDSAWTRIAYGVAEAVDKAPLPH